MPDRAGFEYQLLTDRAREVAAFGAGMFLGLYVNDPELTAHTLAVIVDAASGQELGEVPDASGGPRLAVDKLQVIADIQQVDVGTASEIAGPRRRDCEPASPQAAPAGCPQRALVDVGPLATPARPAVMTTTPRSFCAPSTWRSTSRTTRCGPRSPAAIGKVPTDRGQWEAFTRAGIDPVSLAWETARSELLYGAGGTAEEPTGGVTNYRETILASAQTRLYHERQTQARIDAEEEDRKRIDRLERAQLDELQQTHPHLRVDRTRVQFNQALLPNLRRRSKKTHAAGAIRRSAVRTAPPCGSTSRRSTTTTIATPAACTTGFDGSAGGASHSPRGGQHCMRRECLTRAASTPDMCDSCGHPLSSIAP